MRNSKFYLFLFLISLFVYSCSTSKYYNYDIRLVNPAHSDRRYFENDTFSISFKFDQKTVSFEMYNKLDDGIRINWDELSMSRNGKAKRIIHKETGTFKIADIQPPTTIPPKSKLQDLFYTTDKINYYKVSGNIYTIVDDVYPKSDNGDKHKRNYILGLKGQNVIIYMPYYIKGLYYSKTFEFSISNIYEYKTEKERALKNIKN